MLVERNVDNLWRVGVGDKYMEYPTNTNKQKAINSREHKRLLTKEK